MAPSGTSSTRPGTADQPFHASVNPVLSAQVTPPSLEVKSPCGVVPAHHCPGRLGCPGVSQNVALTARPSLAAAAPSEAGAFANAGGFSASFQVFPRSPDLKT